jgi:hypothetical protein
LINSSTFASYTLARCYSEVHVLEQQQPPITATTTTFDPSFPVSEGGSQDLIPAYTYHTSLTARKPFELDHLSLPYETRGFRPIFVSYNGGEEPGRWGCSFAAFTSCPAGTPSIRYTFNGTSCEQIPCITAYCSVVFTRVNLAQHLCFFVERPRWGKGRECNGWSGGARRQGLDKTRSPF